MRRVVCKWLKTKRRVLRSGGTNARRRDRAARHGDGTQRDGRKIARETPTLANDTIVGEPAKTPIPRQPRELGEISRSCAPQDDNGAHCCRARRRAKVSEQRRERKVAPTAGAIPSSWGYFNSGRQTAPTWFCDREVASVGWGAQRTPAHDPPARSGQGPISCCLAPNSNSC